MLFGSIEQFYHSDVALAFSYSEVWEILHLNFALEFQSATMHAKFLSKTLLATRIFDIDLSIKKQVNSKIS